MRHLTVHDLAADLGDLEPVQVPERLGRPVQRAPDRGLDTLSGEVPTISVTRYVRSVMPFLPREPGSSGLQHAGSLLGRPRRPRASDKPPGGITWLT